MQRMMRALGGCCPVAALLDSLGAHSRLRPERDAGSCRFSQKRSPTRAPAWISKVLAVASQRSSARGPAAANTGVFGWRAVQALRDLLKCPSTVPDKHQLGDLPPPPVPLISPRSALHDSCMIQKRNSSQAGGGGFRRSGGIAFRSHTSQLETESTVTKSLRLVCCRSRSYHRLVGSRQICDRPVDGLARPQKEGGCI